MASSFAPLARVTTCSGHRVVITAIWRRRRLANTAVSALSQTPRATALSHHSLPFLPSLLHYRDLPPVARVASYIPISCFLRISDELAVALLAGESGRLDPGREEG